MINLLNEYVLGDISVRYFIDSESKNVGLTILPKSSGKAEGVIADGGIADFGNKRMSIDSLVQLKLKGDTYPGSYAQGSTMRNGASTNRLQYRDQKKVLENQCETIITTLSDERGFEVTHVLSKVTGADALECYVKFSNRTKYSAGVEMISSFSLGGITPLTAEDSCNSLLVHRLRSRWSAEGRLETRTMEELQLEPSWAYFAAQSERFGQVGSMPVKQYFPFLAIEDTANHIFWGVQLAHNASWQMEVYRRDDAVCISGGLADREFGHWMKNIQGGETFTTPVGILSVCHGGGIDRITQRLTAAGNRFVDQGPESEQSLPVIFNEYCTTWGCPSHENIMGILDKIKGKGIEYFVIDCGWYKEEGIPWDIAMGDYHVSQTLFPEGLQKTIDAIKASGFKPGIWFEIENVGSAAKAYQQKDHLLKRDGEVLTTTVRRFWDMRDAWVREYLDVKVIQMLKHYGFEYIKIDYNDTIGIGCDGAESLGEGLRQNMEASFRFVEKIKEEIPGIIIESCASGGHRLEPRMMRATSMSSFSDAHECVEIPIIAANLHRAVLPRQSQIWSVIRKEDSLKRIAYSVANTFLGRMCLSGDVTELSGEQWNIIESGIRFYKLAAPIIKDGYSSLYGTVQKSIRHPEGWQCVSRIDKAGNVLMVLHTFDGEIPDVIRIPFHDSNDYDMKSVFSDTEADICIGNNYVKLKIKENWKAVAIRLTKKPASIL